MKMCVLGLGVLVFSGGQGWAASGCALEAEGARIAAERVEIIEQASFSGGRGVALKSGLAAATKGAVSPPDVTFAVPAQPAGRYRISTLAAVDAAGAEQMRAARVKQESLFATLQIDGQRPVRRVIFVPWADPLKCVQCLGVFELGGKPQEIRLWLPPGVRLDRLVVQPYRPPAVPKEASDYRPSVVPPAGHPRLWVTPEVLPLIRSRLDHPEHAPHWSRVRALAAKRAVCKVEPGPAGTYSAPLEQAAIAKAFCFLMRQEVKVGREAAELMLAYLPQVEFGNQLDITREVGAAIYAGACVYDWCYDLFSAAERETVRRHLMRLAEQMECGWPPFGQSIVNGHGNEAQINRDLLALSIALYNEDPVPYRYCAYRVLEELVPMRRFEYQSPRHNQGVSYAAYRFGWEMHAAWLMRRMSGREVFDPNIKGVPAYWLYMRLPNGEMLRDGDGVCGGRYWSHPQTFLLCYAYSGDPVLKGEYLRQAGGRGDDLLFLLLNDPAVKAEPRLGGLPLTKDFGPVLGGMVARTGWSVGTNSADVVAEIKGGGYHFGNHQHADAGAFQIYYRGLQAARLGQYGFYGTPYDMNFNKRSAAQNMLLVFDPQEKILGDRANDGGSRFSQTCPRSPAETTNNPAFNYGKVISCSFGPSAVTPAFSLFCADLKNAYSGKVTAFTRQFCFLNLGRPGNPAAMIVLDNITASDPAFKKSWQINTLKPPQVTGGGVRLWNEQDGVTGRLDVCMLWPAPAERTLEVLSGEAAYSVAGHYLAPPRPNAAEARGHRIHFSPRQAQAHDRFLTVLQACDAEPLPVACEVSGEVVVLRLADRAVALPKDGGLLAAPFEVRVPASESSCQVLCAGLRSGVWRVRTAGAKDRQITVEDGKGTLFFESRGGTHRLEWLSAAG